MGPGVPVRGLRECGWVGVWFVGVGSPGMGVYGGDFSLSLGEVVGGLVTVGWASGCRGFGF